MTLPPPLYPYSSVGQTVSGFRTNNEEPDLSLLTPVLVGRIADVALEYAVEVLRILKAQLVGNGGHPLVGGQQLSGGGHHAQLLHELKGRFPGVLLEKPPQGAVAELRHLAEEPGVKGLRPNYFRE